MAITFVDESWDKVNIQVRIGANQNAESNPLVADFPLTRGSRSAPFAFDTMLFWRRDSMPDAPNNSWTNWIQESAGWDRDVNI